MLTANLVPATATVVTIEVASPYPCHPRPTVITWKKEGGWRWQRYWSGYEDDYRENVHDWGAKGPPDSEVNWANQEGHKVTFS